MNKNSEYIEHEEVFKFLEKLPKCPLDGWPRHCTCINQLQWHAHGEVFGAISVEALHFGFSQGVGPEYIVEEFLKHLRSVSH